MLYGAGSGCDSEMDDTASGCDRSDGSMARPPARFLAPPTTPPSLPISNQPNQPYRAIQIKVIQFI